MHAHFLPDQKVSIVRFPTVAVTEEARLHSAGSRTCAAAAAAAVDDFCTLPSCRLHTKSAQSTVCAKRSGSITVVGTVSRRLCDQIIY